jgi:hypothetical protein
MTWEEHDVHMGDKYTAPDRGGGESILQYSVTHASECSSWSHIAYDTIVEPAAFLLILWSWSCELFY